MSSFKLHTAKRRKFLQIIVTGLTAQRLELTEPKLTSNTSADVGFKSLNPIAGQKLVIGSGMNVSFMWELEIGKDEKSMTPIKTDFNVRYTQINAADENEEPVADDDPLHIHKLKKSSNGGNCGEIYRCNFDIVDYVASITKKIKVGDKRNGAAIQYLFIFF